MGNGGTRPTGSNEPSDPKGLLARVLAVTSDAVAIVALQDRRILYANDPLCSVLGSTREQLLDGSAGSLAVAETLVPTTLEAQLAAGDGFVDGVSLRVPGRGTETLTLAGSAQSLTVGDQPAVLLMSRPVDAKAQGSESGDPILHAAAFAASAFLRASHWTDAIDEALGALADAAGAQRAYLYENDEREDGLWMIHRFEWCAPGTGPTGALGTAYPYGTRFARWAEVFASEGVIRGAVSSLPEPEQGPLLADGVRSTVAVPIYVGGRWWGFVGFDDCETEEAGSAEEVEALQVAAGALGAAIEQRSLRARLQEAEITYESLVERLPGVVYIGSPEEGAPDIYLSPQYEELFGVPPERRLNRPNAWKELVHPDDLDEVKVESARSIATNSPFSAEYRICRPDGTIRWVRDECVLIRDAEGEPQFWLGLATDQTGEHEAEQRTTRAEERFRILVEHIPAVPYVESLDGGSDEFYIGPQVEQITGWPAERFKDDDFWASCLHPDDHDWVVAEDRRTDASGEPFSATYRFLRPDGDVIWIHEESQPVTGLRGQRLVQGVMMDVTEEHRRREQAESAEGRYRALVEDLPIVIYQETIPPVGYPSSALTYVSSQFERQFGHGVEQVSSASYWDDMVHPDDRDRVIEASLESIRGGEPTVMEYRIVTTAGEGRWVQDSAVLSRTEPDGTQVWLGVLMDVTERRRAEEQSSRVGFILRSVATAAERFLSADDWRTEIDETLRDLGEATGMGRSYLFEIRSDEAGEQRGWETFEWCAPGISSTIDSPDNQGFRLEEEDPAWRRKLEEGQTVLSVAGDYSEEDQEYFAQEGIVSVLAVPVLVEGRWWGHLGFDDCSEERAWTEGEIESLRAAAGILSAAVERQLVSERLGETEETQRQLIERLPCVVYMAELEDDGGLFYVSPQYEQVFGYTPEERMADPLLWDRLCHPDDLDRVLESSRVTHANFGPFNEEYRVYARDGRIRWIRDEAVCIRDADGEPSYWLGMILDITERRTAQEELRRHDAVLGAVGFAAQRFLDAPAWEEEVDGVLRRLGEAGDASRAYLFRNGLGLDGRTRADVTHEWCAEGIGPTIGLQRSQGMVVSAPGSEGVPVWAPALAAGSTSAIDSVASMGDGVDKELLESMGVKSMLLVPIFVGGQWWGWIGFDQCREERSWSQADKDALRAAAGLLGAVVRRLDAESLLRRSEEQQRLLVERMPAVVYLDAFDAESTAIYISPQIEQMLGITAEERMSTPSLWAESIHPEDRAMVLEESQRTNESFEPFMLDYRMVARDGTVKWVRDEAVVIYDDDGKPLYWQGVLIDITQRKQAEVELERTLALERQAVDRLQALDHMKNTFLTAVSHDLRTPLAAVLGLALTLEREDIQLDQPVIRDLAHRIAVNSRKLDRLVTDLLDLDRLSSGIVEPKLSLTDLGLLARKAVESADYLGDHDVTVDAQSVEIHVDTAKVERIIENLLVNTVRHTPPGTSVVVSVRREGNGALLLVEDDGPGVDPELREAVFEPFRQGAEELSHSPGVGIGLSLVARFAELHGGRAWVGEREGGGASFRVFLPDVVPTEDAPDDETGAEGSVVRGR